VDTLVLKLALTPTLIAAATLAQRRFGAVAGGLIVGLPLTSGPVAFFLALDHGRHFAARSAVGTIAGLAAETAFCLAYARLAPRRGWLECTLAACAAFLLVTPLLRLLPLALWPTYGGVLVVLWLGRRAIRAGRVTRVEVAPRWWDLPARMIVATAFVLALTAAAGSLGPHLSGILSPFPIYAGVLAAFTHAIEGAEPARQLLRGVLSGLFAFATFFAVLGLSLRGLGIAAAFSLAIVAALLVQGAVVAASRAGHGRRRRTARAPDAG